MKKLLLIGAIPPPVGGDAIWAENFVNHQLNKDIQIKIVNTSLIGRRASKLGKKFQIWDELRRTIKIWRLTLFSLVRFKPDLVHVNCNCSKFGVIRDFCTLCIIKLMGVPKVLHCHANVSDGIGQSYVGNFFLKRCLYIATSILVLNEQSAKYCYRISKRKSVVMPNFVDEGIIAKAHVINPKITRIVFVGHMIRTKGLLEMLEVSRRNPHITFLMAGMLNLESFPIKPPDNITFLGNVEFSVIMDLLDSSDLFMFPTYSEGFSVALLEAMARGLPVITTSVGANEEMLENLGGITVPVADVDALCQALVQMEDPEIRYLMSEWNIAKVKNNYTALHIVQKIRHLYSGLCIDSNKLKMVGGRE